MFDEWNDIVVQNCYVTGSFMSESPICLHLGHFIITDVQYRFKILGIYKELAVLNMLNTV